MAKFKKGVSGNPISRPKGSRNLATIRADELFEQMLFGEDKKADAIIAKTISMAEQGDTACIRLCLDRIAPPRKDRPVRFTLPEMRGLPSRPVKPATASRSQDDGKTVDAIIVRNVLK